MALSCAKKPEETTSSSSSNRYLYVAAGACYSGGNTTFTNTTASNVLFRIDTASGQRDIVIADYNSPPAQAGDSPVGIALTPDNQQLYVLVENTAGRRIEKAQLKQSGDRSLYNANTTILSAQLRYLHKLTNQELLLSKSTAIEKINTSNTRVVKGANPYVNAPTAPCATSTTLMSKMLTLNNQFIAFLHAAAAQNRFGFVKPEGFGAAGDCPTAQASPNANAFPVAMAYDSANTRLFVAYSGTTVTTDINSIYVYNLTETASAVTVSATNKIYDASLYPATYPYLLYGISEMTYDPADKMLYVATAINTATTVVNYAIEKFSYDSTKVGVANAQVLTRVGTVPFYNYGLDTKCISQMFVN